MAFWRKKLHVTPRKDKNGHWWFVGEIDGVKVVEMVPPGKGSRDDVVKLARKLRNVDVQFTDE